MYTKWETWTATLLVSLAVVAVSCLGGVAKMFHDISDPEQPITRRDIARYCTCGILAGVILSLVIYWHQGQLTPLLFAVAGLGGFGSLQFLGFGIELTKRLLERLTGVTSKKKND